MDNNFNYYPQDGGTKVWKEKWAPEYVKFSNNPNFLDEEARIGELSRQDFDMLNNSRLAISYRKYRKTGLRNILIARRVISASVFFNSLSEGVIMSTDWEQLYDFLGLDMQGFKSYTFHTGLRLSGIINKNTLLKEEIVWNVQNEFII